MVELNIKWQVIDKQGNFYCESKGHEYSSIPINNIKYLSIKCNELGKIIYSVDEDKLYLNDEGNKFRFSIIYDNKEYFLGLENNISIFPKYYKKAHTDYDLSSKKSETIIESYFCGFDNCYKLDENCFNISALQSIDLLKKELGLMKIKLSSTCKYWSFKVYLEDKELCYFDINNFNFEIEKNLFE